MRALQGHPGQDVSSTVTKRNPRPRKYASASERQAAYRARAPEVCFRAEGKTVDTLDKIAADLDVSRADLLLSMTKFALTNHDWGRFGLTHRPLPYQYGVEQEARTNPAPIWDRPRPKKLGPSVPLTAAQKRKAKALAAAAGRKYPNLVDNIAATRNPIVPTIYSVKAEHLIADAEGIERSAKDSQKAWALLGQTDKYSQAMDVAYRLRAAAAEKNLHIRREILRNAGFAVKSPKQAGRNPDDEPRKVNPMKKPTPAQIAARERFAEMARSGAFKRKASKRKKNPEGVGFEGYDPYASRDRLDEYRQLSDAQLRYIMKDAGEAARAQRGMTSEAKYLDQVNDAATVLYERKVAREKAIARSPQKISKREASAINRLLTGRGGNPAKRKKTVSQKISQLVHEGYPQKQAVAVALSEQRKGKVKRNPATGHKGSRTKLNPMAAPARSASASNYKYSVEAKRLVPGGSVFEPLGGFQTKTQAQDYAKAILASHPSVTLRIKTYK